MDKIVGGNQIKKGRFKLSTTLPPYFKKDAMKFIEVKFLNKEEVLALER